MGGMMVDGNGVARVRCPTCAERFQPRNWMRHAKACARRKREQRRREAEDYQARKRAEGRG